MNVKELIFSLRDNHANYLPETAQEFIRLNSIKESKHDAITQMLEELIQKLSNYEVVESDNILYVAELIDEGELHYDVYFYKNTDVEQWKNSANYNFKPPTVTQISNSTIEEIDQLFEGFELPQGCSFSFVSWSEVLGYQVNMENLEHIGKLKYVAAFLDELTFFGIEEEEMEKEREELDSRCKELDEINKLPPEEQEKHFTSAKDLFEELGLTDERTDEEKELEFLQSYREIYIYKVELFELLKGHL